MSEKKHEATSDEVEPVVEPPTRNELKPAALRRPRRSGAIVLVMILAAMVTAMGLRPGATSVGPVLPELIESLGMNGALAGLLTALPGLSFAIFGLMSNKFASWTGFVGALFIGSLLSTFGLLMRVLTGSWVLFLLMSVIALAGMAIGNVVLPAFIKKEFPRRAAQMATAYTTFLAVGATVPTFLTPILAKKGEALSGVGEGWRLALGAWAGISFAALLLWVFLYARDRSLREKQAPLVVIGGGRGRGGSGGRGHGEGRGADRGDDRGDDRGRGDGRGDDRGADRGRGKTSMWHSRTAVALMFFFGLQSMQAYTQFGWVPAAYRAGGLDASTAGLMLAIISFGGIPGGLLAPSIVARGRHLQKWIVFFASMLVVGYMGIAFLPTVIPWAWAVSLAVSGFCFPMALALIIDKTNDSAVTAAVSGFVQPVGYLLAAAGPFLVGLLFDVIGNWIPILIALALTGIPMAAAGVIAVRGRVVDEDLGANVNA